MYEHVCIIGISKERTKTRIMTLPILHKVQYIKHLCVVWRRATYCQISTRVRRRVIDITLAGSFCARKSQNQQKEIPEYRFRTAKK